MKCVKLKCVHWMWGGGDVILDSHKLKEEIQKLDLANMTKDRSMCLLEMGLAINWRAFRPFILPIC